MPRRNGRLLASPCSAARRSSSSSRASGPTVPKKSHAPLVHAARKVRRALYERYRAFVAAYRETEELLRSGSLARRFLGRDAFPPALPFVCGDDRRLTPPARLPLPTVPSDPVGEGEVCLHS